MSARLSLKVAAAAGVVLLAAGLTALALHGSSGQNGRSAPTASEPDLVVPTSLNAPARPKAAVRPKRRLRARGGHRGLPEAFARLPLAFEPNVGQTDARVAYLVRGAGYTLFLTKDGEAVMSLANSTRLRRAHGREPLPRPPRVRAPSVLRLQFLGARPTGASAERRLPGRVNYLRGDDRDKWRRNVPTYRRVRQQEPYPGIAIEWYSRGGQLEYDFLLKPGADPDRIRLRFAGARDARLARNGDLKLTVGRHHLRQLRPLAYQRDGSRRRRVSARYSIARDGSVALRLGRYDRRRALVIDPVLSYSTYLGGPCDDIAQGVAVDAAGSTYLTGLTCSTAFPTKDPLQSANAGGNYDAFVAKLTPDGSALAYSTYLGGDDTDEARGIALDGSGRAYVAGLTYSTDFPTANAMQSVKRGGVDAFVARLSADGSALAYSTYLGGSDFDVANGIALDASGSAHVVGHTTSADLATAGVVQPTYRGGFEDGFAAKLAPDGSALAYATYLGGGGRERANAIALDAGGSAYVAGYTDSTNFPTAGALQPAKAGSTDAFLAKLGPSGDALPYSTFLGGGGSDTANGIAVDEFGSAYLAGETSSADFPTDGPLQPANAGGGDAFVTKVAPDGGALIYSTFLGGPPAPVNPDGSADGYDRATGIAVDAGGSAVVVGATRSPEFPTVDPIQPDNAGRDDAFVTKLRPDGGALAFSTYLGGSNYDRAYAVALDGSGNAYPTGYTLSTNFPTARPLQPEHAPGITTDVFVAKIEFVGPEIVGTPREGETLTVQLNGWPDRTEPAGYVYGWRRCDASGANCVDIASANSSSYTLTAAEVGSTIRAQVVAFISVTDIRTIETSATTVVSGTTDLAAMFRPILRFDSGEHWRPLSIDAFLSEIDPQSGQPFHSVCDSGPSCVSITNPGTLGQHPGGWLAIGHFGTGSPGDYRSPDQACTGGDLRDCDSGSAAGLYYHETEGGGYKYESYWAFYRYNDFSVGEHEGDWEGMNVAIDPAAPQSFAAAGFDQHGQIQWYLRNSFNLQCDAGGSTSCGWFGDAAPAKRVWAYVASGSHATYPDRCVNGFMPPDVCRSPVEVLGVRLIEANHDGERPWGANNDPATLQAAPPSAGWPEWSGRWGADCAPSFDCNFPPPKSPGRQPRYCWGGHGLTQDPGGHACPSRSQRGAGVAPTHCTSWFGSSVVALACSPRLLRDSLSRGRLRGPAPVRLRLAGRKSQTVASRALVQALGDPLRAGESVVFRGRLPRDMSLFVRATTKTHLVEARFAGARFIRSRRGEVALLRGSRPKLVLRSGGREIRPVAAHVSRLEHTTPRGTRRRVGRR